MLRYDHELPEYPNEPFLPEHVRGGVKRYIENKIEPGGFLMAVLENNLSEACGRADSTNLRYLTNIVSWFYNEAPRTCWGSPAKVDKWLKPNPPTEDLKQ